MIATRAVVLLGLSWLAVCGCRTNQRGSSQMEFNFEHFQTEEQAYKALLERLPPGTSRRAVQDFLEHVPHLTVSHGPDYIAGRYTEPTTSMVKTVWSVGFFFNETRLLEKIKVSRGLIGP